MDVPIEFSPVPPDVVAKAVPNVKAPEIYAVPSSATVVRTIVYLEDWTSGHYCEMNGKPVTEWRAGDWVSWHDDFPHLAANMGRTDRYTLQLTGTL